MNFLKSDKAFMGPTHALSAAAAFLTIMAFMPENFYKVLGTNNIVVVILAGLVTAGAALIPDLDNTQSTGKSSLGYIGDGISFFFRVSSRFLQTLIRTPKDDPDPNPHRGFWHTGISALLLGFLTFLVTENQSELVLPIVNSITWGKVFAFIITVVLCHLALAGLLGNLIKKIKNSAGAFGEIVALLISIIISSVLFINLPNNLNFGWLGISVAAGCLIHMLGDCFTVYGDPILFPVTVFFRGRFWWNTRFLSIKAGGIIEYMIFVPLFSIICLISFLKIAGVV